MKDAGILAKQYANALLNLSSAQKNTAEIEKTFDEFVNAAYKDPRFARFMNSPVVPVQEKENLLKKLMPQDAPAVLGLFLKLVLKKKRFEILPLIENTFQSLSEKKRGVRRAEYISASPITPEAQKKLTSVLESRSFFKADAGHPVKINLVTKVDPSLIGGFVLKLDEHVVDASYKTKLQEMKQKLYAAAV
ncbi:MAG TPA: ATP synthase F1 subunit delta [Candidatus Omnitrophica bacterium]|nr:ATP synthase F1 subunit delta [Candidatus Omnitrophota bacterium]